jgi:hypothetical protein
MCLDDCQIIFCNTVGFVQIEDKFCETESEININISEGKCKEGFLKYKKVQFTKLDGLARTDVIVNDFAEWAYQHFKRIP